MPFRNGIQVASHLRDSGCRAKVIFLTAHEDLDYVEAAWFVGALGYVLKFRIATDLLPAVQEVLQGRRFISSFQLTQRAWAESRKPRQRQEVPGACVRCLS
jgi:DNA-binding NarL/FixJ family response regulator